MRLHDLVARLPAPLRALPLVAFPIAGVWAFVDVTGANQTRYAPVPADDDEVAWVVARTDGTVPGGCQITAQVIAPGSEAATLRLTKVTNEGAVDVWTASTNQNDAHRFVDLPAGAYHLAAFIDDGVSAPAAAPVVLCAGDGARTFVQLAVAESAHELSGTVRSAAGGAAPGAELAFQQEDDEKGALAGVLRVPVRADGTFAVRMQPGRYVVQIVAPNHAAQTRKLTIDDAAQASLKAVLAPAPRVTGTLVDDAGAPIANAIVALGGIADPKAKQVRVTTDEKGAFSLPVRAGQDVAITARDARSGKVARAQLGAAQSAFGFAGVTLVAHEGRRVEGTVSRIDGSAMAFGEVRFRVRDLGLAGVERADANGRFVLDGMPSDADVEVWAEGNATGAWGAQVSTPGAGDQLALVYVAPAY